MAPRARRNASTTLPPGEGSSSCTVRVEGMHCASCEVLLERRLKKVSGVTNAAIDRGSSTATITYKQRPSVESLASVINRDGYRFAGFVGASPARTSRPTARDYFEIIGFAAAFIAIGILLKRADLLPDVAIADGMSLGLVFVLGLVAALSSCLAVTGGLLLAITAKHGESHPGLSGTRKFLPVLSFNTGRLLGYAGFGALLGAAGALLAPSSFLTGVLSLLAALIMILLGAQMLRVLPFLDRIPIKMPKFLAHWLYDRSSGAYRPWAPFLFGAATFFLPCGFTQALQFSVLASGNALSGALTLFVFALGTLPMLLIVGAVSSFSHGSFQRYFTRAAAVFVILLGFLSLRAALRLISLG